MIFFILFLPFILVPLAIATINATAKRVVSSTIDTEYYRIDGTVLIVLSEFSLFQAFDSGEQVKSYAASAKRNAREKNEGRLGRPIFPSSIFRRRPNFLLAPHHPNAWNRLVRICPSEHSNFAQSTKNKLLHTMARAAIKMIFSALNLIKINSITVLSPKTFLSSNSYGKHSIDSRNIQIDH